MSETGSFDFNAFIKESKETLVNPKVYFSTMKTSGGLAEPVIKALIYGVVAGIIIFIWGAIGLGGPVGVYGAGIGAMALVWTVLAALIGVFIGAVVLLVVSSICKGNTDFEACLRVAAAVMVVMPISAVLGFTMGINPVFGAIISLCVNLFALYLAYHGLIETLKADPGTTKIVMYVLIAILVIFMIAKIGTSRRINRYMNDVGQGDLKEMLKDQKLGTA
jgi:hypothetical protein